MEWTGLDQQLRFWAVRLRDDLGVAPSDSVRAATAMARDIASMPPSERAALSDESQVPLSARRDELVAFQSWMDAARQIDHPAVVRAQVLTQLYISFVYLKDTWYRSLLEHCPPHSTVGRVCGYLAKDPIRSFRNAIAHGRWTYRSDFKAITYWPDSRTLAPLEVVQPELDYWQALSRGTAYVTIEQVLQLAA